MKALKANDLDSAATLIKLGANVSIAGSGSESPISVIFGRNMLTLKKVIKEYFSAKKYKEFEMKYQNNRQTFLKPTSGRPDSRSQNSFLGSTREPAMSKTNGNFSKQQLPSQCVDQHLADKSELDNAKKVIAVTNKQTASEEVLTNNTNHEKANIITPPDQTFGGNELELNNQIVGKLSPKHSLPVYKQKIAHYSEQIEEVKAKIEAISQVS